MQSVAVGWQIYELTHRPLDLGLVGLVQFLPGICLFLIAGHAADRIHRLQILRSCSLGFSLCSVLLLWLTLHGLTTPLSVYAVLLWNGTVRAFNAPASQAFVPLLVAEADFPNAIAWSSSVFQTATITGPMIGGIVYGLTGKPVPVYICAAACYFTAFVLLTRIRLPRVERPPQATSIPVLLGGLRFIARNKLVLGAISLDLFAVLLGGAVALLPVYAREILRVGPIGLGALRSAPGVGALLTAVVIAHWPLQRRAGLTMLWCVLAFGIFTIIFGLSRSMAVSLVMLFLIGASDTVSVIVRHTLLQLATPDEMRGRVSAVNTVFIGASNEIGQFESGITAQWFGAVPAVVLGGVGTIAIVITWAALFPRLRKLNRLAPEELLIAEESAPSRASPG